MAVIVLALGNFGWGLISEPHFVDESAYISQSFYGDLLIEGRWDDPAWLSYAGYDLPPLPKYLIGLALRLDGDRRPGPPAMRAWYRDTSSRFGNARVLTVARIPSLFLGVGGCLAIYALGTVALDRRLGFLAAVLLMVNPLYTLHARRAMSDVPAESFLLMTLAVGLWAWKRLLIGRLFGWASLTMVFGSGLMGGLATLCKLNGALSGIILGAWSVLALGLTGFPIKSRSGIVAATLGSGLVSFGTFAALNPFLYAHPSDPGLASVARLTFLERTRVVAQHRVAVSDEARTMFPNDALETLGARCKAVLIQGLGRFGPLGPRGRTDSTRRFEAIQDWSVLVWLPWVVLGGLAAFQQGQVQIRQGQPPAAWAILVQASVALVVVTSFIPLAWDRYYLSIQPGFALLGAFALVSLIDGIKTRREPSL